MQRCRSALSASTIALSIADHPHFTAQGEILSGGPNDRNIGYCRGISDGGRHRLAGQVRLQLEAALEAARATRPSAKTTSPVVLSTGNPTNPNQTKRRSLAAAPPIAQLVWAGFPQCRTGRSHAWSRIASNSRFAALAWRATGPIFRGCASAVFHTDAGSRSGRRSFQVIVSSPSRRNGTPPAGALASSA